MLETTYCFKPISNYAGIRAKLIWIFKGVAQWGTSSRRASSTGETFIQDRIDVLDGEVTVYRSKQSGDVYQFRFWISGEGRYYRKSTKTRDRNTAIQRAKDEFFRVKADIQNGKKIFGGTFDQLVADFLQNQETRVQSGKITKERFSVIRTQIQRHFLSFVGKSARISEIGRSKFLDYAQFRRKHGARDVTIRNEQATINALFKYGFRKGYTSLD